MDLIDIIKIVQENDGKQVMEYDVPEGVHERIVAHMINTGMENLCDHLTKVTGADIVTILWGAIACQINQLRMIDPEKTAEILEQYAKMARLLGEDVSEPNSVQATEGLSIGALVSDMIKTFDLKYGPAAGSA